MDDLKEVERARRAEFTRRLYQARELIKTLPAYKLTSLGPPWPGALPDD